MIIGISGKINSGKDTAGELIKDLSHELYDWEIKKFAGKLKEIVALIIGCSVEKLESQEFKNTSLPEMWDKRKVFGMSTNIPKEPVEKMTPRLMIQLLGTEGGRKVIHENIWVNALFSDYKPTPIGEYDSITVIDHELVSVENGWCEMVYPDWIITDMRFPNELEAVKKHGGITIRVNRGDGNTGDHASETALDDAQFDYTIDNNGTLRDFSENLKQVLIAEQLIK